MTTQNKRQRAPITLSDQTLDSLRLAGQPSENKRKRAPRGAVQARILARVRQGSCSLPHLTAACADLGSSAKSIEQCVYRLARQGRIEKKGQVFEIPTNQADAPTRIFRGSLKSDVEIARSVAVFEMLPPERQRNIRYLARLIRGGEVRPRT